MQPVQDIIHRIRWDPEFGAGVFQIGYYDRQLDAVIVVAFSDLHFEEGDHFAFHVVDDEGVTHRVPFHRVRDIYRETRRIWHRDA